MKKKYVVIIVLAIASFALGTGAVLYLTRPPQAPTVTVVPVTPTVKDANGVDFVAPMRAIRLKDLSTRLW